MKTTTRIEKITSQLNGIMTGIENGNKGNNALTAYIELKKIADLVKTTMDEIKSDAMDELDRHGKGEHVICDAIVSISNVGGRWKFDHIDEWSKLKSELTNVESRLKTAYKSHQSGLMSVNESTGEISELPIYSGSTETIKIRLPKKAK